jgi:hypothetical protein
MCGYEVAGMILLQAYLYTYSLLRGVTFEVLPFSSYALSPRMLPLLETFLELLLWNSIQCHHHIFCMSSVSWNFHLYMADFISGNSQKSFRAKSREEGRCCSVIDISATDCTTESALWAEALSWWRIQSLGQSSGLFYVELYIIT